MTDTMSASCLLNDDTRLVYQLPVPVSDIQSVVQVGMSQRRHIASSKENVASHYRSLHQLVVPVSTMHSVVRVGHVASPPPSCELKRARRLIASSVGRARLQQPECCWHVPITPPSRELKPRPRSNLVADNTALKICSSHEPVRSLR